MKRRPLCILCYLTAAALAAAALALVGGTSASAQEFEPPKVTEHHKRMAREVGTWDVEMKVLLPDGPQVTKGVERNRLIAGGLWLVTHYRGEFMGKPFIGHGMVGYDSQKEKYVGTWVDNSRDSIATMEGTYDAEKKEMTFLVKRVNPETKQEMTERHVTTFVDENTKTFSIFVDVPEVGELKVLEITAKRRPEEAGADEAKSDN